MLARVSVDVSLVDFLLQCISPDTPDARQVFEIGAGQKLENRGPFFTRVGS
jgi:hypothetical protein